MRSGKLIGTGRCIGVCSVGRSLVVRQGLVMRLSGGTWDLNHYRIVGIRPS